MVSHTEQAVAILTLLNTIITHYNWKHLKWQCDSNELVWHYQQIDLTSEYNHQNHLNCNIKIVSPKSCTHFFNQISGTVSRFNICWRKKKTWKIILLSHMGIVFVSYIYIKFLHTCINGIFLAHIKKSNIWHAQHIFIKYLYGLCLSFGCFRFFSAWHFDICFLGEMKRKINGKRNFFTSSQKHNKEVNKTWNNIDGKIYCDHVLIRIWWAHKSKYPT